MGKLAGIGIGRGIVVGRVRRLATGPSEPSDDPRPDDVGEAQELERAQEALNEVHRDLEARAELAARQPQASAEPQSEGSQSANSQSAPSVGNQSPSAGSQSAEIVQALAQMAADPALLQAIETYISSGKTAERAVFEGFRGFEHTLTALGGYMAERAADLHDVGQRVIANLLGLPAPGVQQPVPALSESAQSESVLSESVQRATSQSVEPYILVAQDLSPADAATLDLNLVLAIVTSQGGPTSHTAILARARGILAVVSAVDADDLTEGEQVIVNATTGEITEDPDDEQIQQAHAANAQAGHVRELRGKPGALRDGTAIALLANVGSPDDAQEALEFGAEGVGLFRTEFLFIGNEQAPGIEEQTQAYTKLLAAFPERKVVIRLLDAGADKPLPFLTPDDEPNPALGLRGLRKLRTHASVLEDQLEALARAQSQTDADLWVMAPMIADQYETRYFVNLGKSKGLHTVGAMAEVPSIALMADEVAQVADFVSIGTNDLTQYTLAADRTLGSVSSYQSAWHPAVLRAIKLIADAGAAHGMPVGVCGEAAADPDLAVVLAGLGVTSLSMTARALDDVRAELAKFTLEQARGKAREALSGEQFQSAW